jgi:hypothetical protein
MRHGTTEEAHYQDVFKHTNISFTTNVWEGPVLQPVAIGSSSRAATTAGQQQLHSSATSHRKLGTDAAIDRIAQMASEAASCRVTKTPSWVPSHFSFIAKFVMLPAALAECVAGNAAIALDKMGEMAAQSADFLKMLASGQMKIEKSQPIGA